MLTPGESGGALGDLSQRDLDLAPLGMAPGASGATLEAPPNALERRTGLENPEVAGAEAGQLSLELPQSQVVISPEEREKIEFLQEYSRRQEESRESSPQLEARSGDNAPMEAGAEQRAQSLRVFQEVFGPVPIEELKRLAERDPDALNARLGTLWERLQRGAGTAPTATEAVATRQTGVSGASALERGLTARSQATTEAPADAAIPEPLVSREPGAPANLALGAAAAAALVAVGLVGAALRKGSSESAREEAVPPSSPNHAAYRRILDLTAQFVKARPDAAQALLHASNHPEDHFGQRFRAFLANQGGDWDLVFDVSEQGSEFEVLVAALQGFIAAEGFGGLAQVASFDLTTDHVDISRAVKEVLIAELALMGITQEILDAQAEALMSAQQARAPAIRAPASGDDVISIDALELDKEPPQVETAPTDAPIPALTREEALGLSFDAALLIPGTRFRGDFLEGIKRDIEKSGTDAALPIEQRANAAALNEMFSEVTRIAGEQGLLAHGVAWYKGGLFNLISIMLTGSLHPGANRGSLSLGQAGDHGPNFILGRSAPGRDWKDADQWEVLLVPEASDRAHLERALQEAVKNEWIGGEKAAALLAKVRTYAEFVS